MEAVWKLRVGAEAYYVAQVASGLDEYYTGAGEAPGVWVGAGIGALGLTGEVDPVDLRAVLAGLAPGTGLSPNGSTLRAHRRRVPGFDLTFAVPKSVSVAYALGDRRVQHLIVGACEAALTETLGWLEREACFVRRGTNKAENRETWGERWGTRRMVANGFVAAGFRHRTSREGDPHLHWHVLVANLAQGIDGRWSALDGTAIYQTARTGGAVFQTAMRRELSEVLGVEWGPVHEDTAEIAGIPEPVLRAFSQRHEQIAEWLDTHGASGSAAAGVAQRATRRTKQVPGEFAAIEAVWHQRADALGWGPAEFEQLLAAGTPAALSGLLVEAVVWRDGVRHVGTRLVEFDEWLEWLLETRVTAHDGTFTRFDLTRAIGSALPASTSADVVDSTVQRALASPAVVPIGDHAAEAMPVWASCRMVFDDRDVSYTTRSLLQLEERLVCQLSDGVCAGVGVLDPAQVDRIVAGSTLGADQAAAAQRLVTAGDRVAVLVGRAGTGKTHTLGTVRALYEEAGFTMIGLAPSARAARELQAGAGIESTTIARHLVERRQIDATTVVVVDEAGMVGVRDLAHVIDQVTRIGAKVILVGDHHQLPEVAAGGGFRATLDALAGRVAELTVNRRQQHQWEQTALDRLRHGDVTAAFAAYRDHDRVIIADDRAGVHDRAIADWCALRSSGDTLMLSGTRAEAHRLNRIARQQLIESGEIDITQQFVIDQHQFAPGDHVLLRRNDRGQHLANGTAFGVDNGMRATITGIDDRGVHVTLSTGEQVVLDRSYVADGWVEYAYASTIHTAQGVTCDHVLLIGPAGLYREGIYVALSRARLSAWFYATTTQAAEIERHDTGIPLPTDTNRIPEHELVARMHRSGAKTLAGADDPDAAQIAELAASVPVPELVTLARQARQAEQVTAARCADPVELRSEFERALAARMLLVEGRRVRALDRDNIGTIVALDDSAGVCDVHFVNDHGRCATRTLGWDQLVVIDHPDPVEPTPTAATTLERIATTVYTAEQQWATELATRGFSPGDATRYQRAINVATERAAHQLRADQPEWLTSWLGPRPTDAPGAAVWDDTTRRLAHYRTLHRLDDSTTGLGPRPDHPDTAAKWQHVMLRTLEDRIWLNDRHHQPTPTLTTRSPADLVERRHQLEQLMRTAPPDQRHIIERLTTSHADPVDLHEHLVAATHAQHARSDWIIANWPHVVELEQINTLIAAQPPLAHWPTPQPPAITATLAALAQLAPTLDHREDRSLAQIDQDAVTNDPVGQLEQQLHHLDQLATRATTAERSAVQAEQRAVRRELGAARRAHRADALFARYGIGDHPETRQQRAVTIAHDVLTEPPAWVIDHLTQLHNHGQLPATRPDELAALIVGAAAHLDQHGHLPHHWQNPQPMAIGRVLPAPEISPPGH